MSCNCRYELNDKGHYGKCAKDSKYFPPTSQLSTKKFTIIIPLYFTDRPLFDRYKGQAKVATRYYREILKYVCLSIFRFYFYLAKSSPSQNP